MTEIISKTLVLPTGMEIDDTNLHSFALEVVWRGPRTSTGRGGWGVQFGGEFRQLSRAGKWGRPQPFQQHQYRWETREEALEMARAIVDSMKQGHYTFAEWQAFDK